MHQRPSEALCSTRSLTREPLPAVFSANDGWDAQYAGYHSPDWWRVRFEETRLVEIVECMELVDGLVMWEDEVLYHGERAGWTDQWWETSLWLIEQLIYSRDSSHGLTHYVMTLEKKDWSKQQHLG